MFRVGVSTFWQDFILIQFSTYFLKALSFLLPLNTCNLQIKIFVSLVTFRNTWTWITTGAVCSFTVSEGDDSLLWKCVFLCDLDWQVAIKTSQTTAIRAPIYPVYGVCQTNNGCMQVYFFLPSPSPILTRQPLPWNQFLTWSNSWSVWTFKLIAL